MLEEDYFDNKSKYYVDMPQHIDLNVIGKRIEELNLTLENHEVKNNNGVNKFVAVTSKNVLFFTNGMCFEDAKFSPYSTDNGKQILCDLLDGYFPNVYKKK